MIRIPRVGAAVAWICVIAVPVWAAGPNLVLGPEQVLRGEFEQQRHLVGFDTPLDSSGRFVVAGDLGVLWRTQYPFQFDLVITPNGLLQIVPGEAPVEPLASQAGVTEILGIFTDILGAGTADRALDRFEIREKSGPGTVWSRILTPISAQLAAQIETITIFGSGFVERVEVRRTSGDRDILTFSNQGISDDPPTDEEIRLLTLTVGNTPSP